MIDGAEVWKDEQTAETDISALIQSAIQKKQEKLQKEVKENFKRIEVEQTPEGQSLTWKTTPEQIALINLCDRDALDKFYFDNLQRIKYSAYRFMRHNPYAKICASWEDLVQQLYCDLRTGLLKLRPFDNAISKAVYVSFKIAPVGGLDEVYIYEDKKKCRKRQN